MMLFEILTLGLIITTIIMAIVVTVISNKNSKLSKEILTTRIEFQTHLQYKEQELQDKQVEVDKLMKLFTEEKARNDLVISQKKSSETNLGLAFENIVGMLPNLPYKSSELRHISTPIDYLYYHWDDPEGPSISFIEVKTNNSKESKRQKIVKNAIKNGRIFYEVLRLDKDGIKIKREENN